MTTTSGTLVFVTVEYFRNARYRRRHQSESHRTGRYRVRYELDGQPPHDAVVGPNPPQGMVSEIRDSRPGDLVVVTISEDGQGLAGWTNKTREELLQGFDAPWGECD